MRSSLLAATALVVSTAFISWQSAGAAPTWQAAEGPVDELPMIPAPSDSSDATVENDLYELDHTVVPPAPPEPVPAPEPAPPAINIFAAAPPAPPPPPPPPPAPPPPPPAPAINTFAAAPAASVGGQVGLGSVNGFRSANGVGGLAWDGEIAAAATAWSHHMVSIGSTAHRSNLFAGTSGCRTVGENVAFAGSLERALTLLEESPGHRSNLLNGAFDRVGIGVVEAGGRVYVTQIFCG